MKDFSPKDVNIEVCFVVGPEEESLDWHGVLSEGVPLLAGHVHGDEARPRQAEQSVSGHRVLEGHHQVRENMVHRALQVLVLRHPDVHNDLQFLWIATGWWDSALHEDNHRSIVGKQIVIITIVIFDYFQIRKTSERLSCMMGFT